LRASPARRILARLHGRRVMAEPKVVHPYYPIIYVRGYAGTSGEVEDTVSDPYMGFNLGSTRVRTAWTGKTERLYFESPLVRLMKDHDYTDVYSVGLNKTDIKEFPDGDLDARSIIIYRYYDQVSSVFGEGKQVAMEDFGRGLNDLILKVRKCVCKTDEDRAKFKVYLVGHSMGGLVIRCFLQNPKVGSAEARALVDKVFTYATPHNGIELEIIGNVPGFFDFNSVTNFNRERMCQYLGLPEKTERVNTLNGMFSPDRVFCLVGTNSKDYTAAAGFSSRVVGPFSDGLVRINNAVISGFDEAGEASRLSPRAYIHRSHSGYYGIVNSEEGYQNLTRFLFGDVRVDGRLDIRAITLPADVQKKHDEGKEVRASYHFEVVASVRGAHWELSRRVIAENSALFRSFADLFPDKAKKDEGGRENHESPELFTAFLSAGARVNKRRKSLGFSIDIRVLVPDYEVDGILFLDNHYPGGHIFRDRLNVEAIPSENPADWRVNYAFESNRPTDATKQAKSTPLPDRLEFRIPIVQKARPGIDADLVLTARHWN
jgi:hypothetical protein